MKTICHNCKGKGVIPFKNRIAKPSSCLYCNGLGTVNKNIYNKKE